MTHDLGKGWTAKRVGKGFDVFKQGEFKFHAIRLKTAKAQIMTEGEDGAPREPWLAAFDAELRRVYGITLEDAGADPDATYARWSDMTPAEAVRGYGEKYGLIESN
jgi:hypothetical protein